MRGIEQAYYLEAKEALRRTTSGVTGLSSREARLRLTDGGENLLPTTPPPCWRQRLLGQLGDPMVVILLLAAVLSALLSAWTDSAIILIVVLANAVLGTVQEGRAERAAEELARLSAPQAMARRDGEWQTLPARQLVVGDVVALQAGDVVPADLRLLSQMELACDESSLTGESLPVYKQTAALPRLEQAQAQAQGQEQPQPQVQALPPLAEQSNLAFMGTPVVRGRGEGVVIAVGRDTAMGRIADLLEQKQTQQTPLQKRLAELSRVLSMGVLVICLLVFVLTLLQGTAGWLDALLLAVSLAVAAIPEGLVVVVTLVLSLGMNTMSRKNAIIRRLNAVETLGAVQVICSDKTGTLTENRMQVVIAAGEEQELAYTAALCHSLHWGEGGAVLGDPTEVALAEFAAARGLPPQKLMGQYPLVAELPFDSSRKMMSTLHGMGQHQPCRQYSKGAWENILACCDFYLQQGRRLRLDEKRRQQIAALAARFSRESLRVLAAAYAERPEAQGSSISSSGSTGSIGSTGSSGSTGSTGSNLIREQGMTFLGLWGLMDPPRPSARGAVQAAAEAGVMTVMVSGDNPDTAAAIGSKLGILPRDGGVMSGPELAALSDRELQRRLPELRVFARVRPEDKLRIVRAWQKRGAVVAMTGDGVNDAPALQAADIGVGMGKCGAEVSKQASALVLADDHFATIVTAVEEGRRIYDNIRRAVQFLLASNLAEVLAIFAASLFGLQLFLPIHLLWINLVTDCLPAVALGVEAAAPDVMRRPPRSSRESLFAQGMGLSILRQGGALAALTLCSYWLGRSGQPGAATTMAFITLSGGELFHAWNMRSRIGSIFGLPTANHPLTGAMLAAFALNLLLLYWPGISSIFRLTALSASQLLCACLLAFAIVPLVEAEKWLLRRRQQG